jgi:myo-inositol-1(or 4)-monophosphatase
LAQKKESFSDITLLAIEAALLAGDILRQGYGTHFSIENKEGTHNLVTEYDHKAEKAILSFVKQHAPNSRFLAEESGESGKANEELTWVVDPLDGTVNFAHQIPIFSVSIGVEREGKTISGVVLQPMTQELFVAETGKGAFFNGKPLQVSKTSNLHESILATGFPYNLKENPFHCIEHFTDILRAGIPIRRIGSAALDFAYTAAGRFEGFFEVSLSPWDCSAGKLLLEEAGGKVTNWDGRPFDIRSRVPLLATNGHIHKEALTLLNRSQ